MTLIKSSLIVSMVFFASMVNAFTESCPPSKPECDAIAQQYDVPNTMKEQNKDNFSILNTHKLSF
ncbi:hypothetical protein QN092_08995 [Proteus vulgaris]|uniref:hypothetical protein n=1 Tax=Proteus vulgaris TaxID=585 RepID=UPI000659518C|nr:hypothetical protein [Proteus vulgaris]WIF73995.1 hypothetical protein QN092_08995 [Proteus vulgaris]CRL59285.1 hypothetical protein BN1805_00104 [Proteus vulgaris]